MANDIRTMQELAAEALQVQDACNLTGVAISYAKAIVRLRHLLDAQGKGGTDNVRHHPISVLWADKIADLAGRDVNFSEAYRTVCDLKNGL